jgi:hypothetical protein
MPLVSAALLHRHREDLAPIHSNKLFDHRALTLTPMLKQIWPVIFINSLIFPVSDDPDTALWEITSVTSGPCPLPTIAHPASPRVMPP